MKISIENIEEILIEQKIPNTNEIIRKLTQAAEEEAEERRELAGPKQKFEHIVIINDPDGKINPDEHTAWVVQQKQDNDAGLILDKFVNAAKTQNESGTSTQPG